VGAAFGSIDINSNPDGAKVYLDGTDTGQITPIVLTNKSAGTHTVKLELYLYESKEDTTISVAAGETTYLNWPLTYATTQNLTLQPGAEGKDAFVIEDYPDMNLGNNPMLYVGYYSPTQPKFRTYLYFDVSSSSLPSDAVVTSAYLKLHQWGFWGTGSLPIGLYQVTEDWTEGAITWNNQPGSSSDAESTDSVYSSSTDTWRSWYIKDLLKGWLDGSITNYGMLLKPVSEPATNLVYFDSSDNSTLRPQLLISYYIP
jgi:hypothetical protein